MGWVGIRLTSPIIVCIQPELNPFINHVQFMDRSEPDQLRNKDGNVMERRLLVQFRLDWKIRSEFDTPAYNQC